MAGSAQNGSRAAIASLILLERAFDMLDYAVLLVDGDARIEFRNQVAAALLRKPECPLGTTNGVLSAKARGPRAQLKEAISEACGTGRSHGLRLSNGDVAPERWLRLIIAPLHSAELTGCAAIWVMNGQSVGVPSERMLSVLFGLSPAEARLARGLLLGRTPDEHARHAGVGVATVRTQLHSIFSKTGVRRQAELVALLARVPALQLGEP
ncbi:MAG TPA: helix-turn-helix transcriptional regulator [Burkholderiales bacterium]|jgi:DNA-binding CsgD family transcriptional regulator|nr:helix-turn-helix transcriptional regulator [Burkholderiales bacterium]